MPDIHLNNVDKSYDGNSKAVSDLTLHIEDGDFMCLLGPSGCGKTTTLRSIAGLENISGGEISVNTRVLDSRRQGIFVPPEKREMGLVFQSYALWPHLTIEKNTDFGLRLRGVSKKEREERVDHVMTTLGIDKFRDRYPSQLSGGQQQRVALARMLVIKPTVLLLDEPLSNLDSRLRLEMRAELKRIHSEFGTTIVFVTHDQWEAMTLATKIAVMNEGTLQQVGTPDDIYDRPANTFVAEFVGSPPINRVNLQTGKHAKLSSICQDYIEKAFPDQKNVHSIGLRPESLTLSKTNETISPKRLTGDALVSAILPTGGSWIVELNIEGTALFITTSSAPSYTVGESLLFQVDRHLVHLFDSSGHRIPQVDENAQRATD